MRVREPTGFECPECRTYDINHPLDVACELCHAGVEMYCTDARGVPMPFFHRPRLDLSHSHLNAPTLRARFQGRDGRSFFAVVTPDRPVWMLYEMSDAPPLFSPDAAIPYPTSMYEGRTVAYRREIWVGIHPMASPMWTSRGWADVVYRYESG